MAREIKAKTLLVSMKNPASWFGVKYNLNIYRGCEHQCIYCDSRSECYQIEDFSEVIVKVNALEILQKELAGKRVKGTIGTGAMSDPYTPVEQQYNLTGRALELIAQYHFPVHIITKSNLIVKDIEALKEINKIRASVAFTITTNDDALAKILEPGAPSPTERFAAMKQLAEAGICTGVTMMPILPYIEDTPDNIVSIVRKTAECGGKYIISSFGVTLRDRQRDYYYQKLQTFFAGAKEKYQLRYGNQYSCKSDKAEMLRKLFEQECKRLKLATTMDYFGQFDSTDQLSLF